MKSSNTSFFLSLFPDVPDGLCPLSAVSQTALLGLTRVIKAPVKFERYDEKGFLHVTVNTDNEDVRRRTDDVLNTMLCGIKDMAEGYPQFIKLEEKNHVY